MMTGVVAIFFVIIFEEREIHDPEKCGLAFAVLGDHPEFRADAQADRAERVEHDFVASIRDDEDEIAFFQLSCWRARTSRYR